MQTVAHLSLSVDLEIGGPTQRTDMASDAGRMVLKLSELATRLGLPLTWASPAPEQQSAVRGWPKLPATHDWALLIESSLVSAGGDRFARELGRRATAALAADLHLNTVAFGAGVQREFLDPIVRAGFSVVRSAGPTADRVREPAVAPAFRAGLLRVVPFARLPDEASRGWRSTESHLRRALQSAILSASPLHFALDAPRLARSASALRQVERLLTDAADARDRGRLRVATLAELAALRRPAATRRQAVSILRAA